MRISQGSWRNSERTMNPMTPRTWSRLGRRFTPSQTKKLPPDLELSAATERTTIMKKIPFYRVNEPYGEFSNFAPYPIELKGKVWPTSEHYFQAQKFADTDYEEAICQAETPMVAANMGRNRERMLRLGWEGMKDDIMREALRAKFTQHPALQSLSLLLAAGDAELVEHTTNDRYWADGGDGGGRNRLGQLLMELRAQLR